LEKKPSNENLNRANFSGIPLNIGYILES